MSTTLFPVSANATGFTNWGGTWYTGGASFAIDQNYITSWTYNNLGSISFNLGSAFNIDKLTFSFDGHVSNGNYVEIYIDGDLVAEGVQPASQKVWDVPNTLGQFITYKTVAKPHNEYLQIATWSELSEFSAEVITDTAAPTIVSVSPNDAATGVQISSNFVLTFTEAVQAGTGSFVLKSGSTTIGSINVNDASQVTINGNQVTINPLYDLSYGTNYTVISPLGIVKDLAGNNWAGTSTYDFTTVNSLPPLTYEAGTGSGISQANFSAQFSQASVQATGSTMSVQLANGNSYIFKNYDLLQFTDRTISIAEVAAQQDPHAVFRFYNTTTGTHFYTGSAAEADSVVRNLELFNYEGVAFDKNSVVGGDSIDVFRFYNAATGTHFYTGSVAEKNSVMANLPNFNYEGVAYQAHSTESSGTTELYRFYNTQTGTHFYTASEAEMQNVKATLAGVYNYEGVAYYVDVA